MDMELICIAKVQQWQHQATKPILHFVQYRSSKTFDNQPNTSSWLMCLRWNIRHWSNDISDGNMDGIWNMEWNIGFETLCLGLVGYSWNEGWWGRVCTEYRFSDAGLEYMKRDIKRLQWVRLNVRGKCIGVATVYVWWLRWELPAG